MTTKTDDDQNSYRRLKYNIEAFLISTAETLKKSTSNKGTKILFLNNWPLPHKKNNKKQTGKSIT